LPGLPPVSVLGISILTPDNGGASHSNSPNKSRVDLTRRHIRQVASQNNLVAPFSHAGDYAPVNPDWLAVALALISIPSNVLVPDIRRPEHGQQQCSESGVFRERRSGVKGKSGAADEQRNSQ